MPDAPIIAPLNQFNYFSDTLFYQYLGTEQGSIDFKNFIDPAYTDVSNGIEHIYQTILSAFKIDDAVGVQLDIIGNIIGLPRPTNESVGIFGFFGFDGSPLLPFDIGEFADGREADEALVSDERYRFYIRIKIAKNIWDGTKVSLKALLVNAFSVGTIEIENMVPINPVIAFAFDAPGQGFDDGFLDGNIKGQSLPANYRIILNGGAITQDEINELLLLDLIPTPQGVKMFEVIVIESIFVIENGSQFVIENGNIFSI